MTSNSTPCRILIIDDNKAIQNDFIKALTYVDNHKSTLEESLFDEKTDSDRDSDSPIQENAYIIETASQGQEALQLVEESIANRKHFALAFVDIRMPPGWDGIETIKRIWEVDPDMQMVIVSAYSEFSWEQILRKLKSQINDNLLILKKPFEVIEIRQFAFALTKKWQLNRQIQQQIDNLQDQVDERTIDLKKSLSLTNAMLEATSAGIIVVSKNQSVIKYNKKFLELWDISENVFKSNESNHLFQKLAEKVENASGFLRMIQNLDNANDIDNSKELKLKTRKTLELYQQSQQINNEDVAVVYSFRDVTARKNLEKQLLYKATHDDLTELPNRVLLPDRIQQAILLSKIDKSLVGVLLIDLDNFKHINETMGHKVGNFLLKKMSKKIRGLLSESDTLIHFDSDEFVVVIHSKTNDEMPFINLANRLLDIIKQPLELENCEIIQSQSVTKNLEFNLTMNIGISYYPKDGEDSESLMQHAEAALYHAKEMGGNTYQIFGPQVRTNFLRDAELLASFRQSLEKNELIIQYQPYVELSSSKVLGAQTKLFWHHSNYGTILTKKILELSEDAELHFSIGEWLLWNSCSQLKSWHETGLHEFRLAIEIYANQFRHKNFINSVKKVLDDTKVSAQYVELEIPVNILSQGCPDFIQKINQLKEMGFHLTMEEFDASYSHMRYLKFYLFDKVTIDRAYIDEVSSDDSGKSTLGEIINMLKNIGVTPFVNGVDNERQFKFLQTYNIQVVGNYLFPSVPAENLQKLVQTKDKTLDSKA